MLQHQRTQSKQSKKMETMKKENQELFVVGAMVVVLLIYVWALIWLTSIIQGV